MKRSLPLASVRSATAVGVSLLLILTLGLFAAACSGGSNATATTVGSGTSPTTAGSNTTAGRGATVQVIMNNRAYDPARVTVKIGDTVTWVNQDSPQHDVVADNGEFKSSLFDKGATFSYTFTKAGTYPYHCSIHPGMTGTVVVQ
jgi:plastocyanin